MIEFIITGDIRNNTFKLITDINNSFPNSDIKLMTWMNSDDNIFKNIHKLKIYKIKDPGCDLFDINNNKIQINATRQAILLSESAKYITGKIIIKLRSDTELFSSFKFKILKIANNLLNENKIYLSSTFSADTELLGSNYQHHVSDWFIATNYIIFQKLTKIDLNYLKKLINETKNNNFPEGKTPGGIIRPFYTCEQYLWKTIIQSLKLSENKLELIEIYKYPYEYGFFIPNYKKFCIFQIKFAKQIFGHWILTKHTSSNNNKLIYLIKKLSYRLLYNKLIY